MGQFPFWSVVTFLLVTVSSSPDVSFLQPPGSPTIRQSKCSECKVPTKCQSEVIVDEIEVPKEVSLPNVEVHEKIVYRNIPVTHYEVETKVNFKPIQVPDQKVTFIKYYQDKPSIKQLVRKPLIKYNVTTLDVEVERLVIHEKPTPKNVTVDKTKFVPEITDTHEPILVERRRPVGKPQPQAKHVTVPEGIKRVMKETPKVVQVPEVTVHYCDNEKKIYVPDNCPEASGGDSSNESERDKLAGGTSPTTTSTTSTPPKKPSGTYIPARPEN